MKIDQTGKFQVGGLKATYVLTICSLLYAFNYADRYVMAVVLQPMKIELGLTDLQMGIINAAFNFGAVICLLPIAHFVDTWSRRKMIGLMAIGWSMFTLFTGMAGGYIQLILARLGVGMGESGFIAGGTALVSASYAPEKRARKLAIFSTFVTVGVLSAYIGGGYVSAKFGWRVPFYFFGIPGVILGVLAFFMQDYSTAKADGSAVAHESVWKNLAYIFKIPSLVNIYIGALIFNLLLYAALTWIPALLMRAYGLKEDKAGMIMAVAATLPLIGYSVGGWWADKWHQKRSGGRMLVSAVCMAFVSISFLLMLSVTWDLFNKPLMIFSMIMFVVFGFTPSMVLPGYLATSQDVVKVSVKGLASGMAFLFATVGGLLGTIAVGALSDAFGGGYKGLSYALYVAALFGIPAAFFFWKSAGHVEEDMKKAKVS